MGGAAESALATFQGQRPFQVRERCPGIHMDASGLRSTVPAAAQPVCPGCLGASAHLGVPGKGCEWVRGSQCSGRPVPALWPARGVCACLWSPGLHARDL